MKIGVTLFPYGELQPAGLAETIYSLSAALAESNTEHTFVYFVKGTNHMCPKFIENTRHEFRSVGGNFLWLDNAIQHGEDIDVWIYHTPMLPLFKKPEKSVVIALDFAYLHYPGIGWVNKLKTFLTYQLHKRALMRCTHIVSISEFTKNEVVRWFPHVDREKITTIMAGFRFLSNAASDDVETRLPKNFFLSLGVLKYRKNQLNVVKGFLRAKGRGLEGDLVVYGKGSGEYYDLVVAAVENSQYKSSVNLAGYATDNEVVSAYTKTTALVFPSRLEGFGFPVLEAMSLGVPVVTSNTNSVGEIAGDAAITVDPESVEEIADAFIKMQDEDVRSYYIAKGFDRIKEFSWRKTARRLVRVIESI